MEISDKCGDSLMSEQLSFQIAGGGSIPTSPLQLFIRLVNKRTACVAYRRWHYFGSKGFLASYNYGVYFNDSLVGAISFGIPNARNVKELYTEDTQRYWLELTRFALSDACPKNSESRVISITIKFLKKLLPDLLGIITYADTAYNHTGIIYRASNFKYWGLTAQKTDLFINGKAVGKLKNVKYSELGGEWIKRSRKHLFVMEFPK